MSNATIAPETWQAFPNRINQYLGQGAQPANPNNWQQSQLWEFADAGTLDEGPYPQIPLNQYLCPQVQWDQAQHPYGPYGPRGWMDGYCEWSVTRNTEGKITRVDFTCENPEYWNTVWKISPTTAAQIYEDTLNYGLPASAPHITVTVEDLQLVDPSTGDPVIDPSTNQPAYNPLNKWNSGPVSVRTGSNSDEGGAMHLTSTPNRLQTETGLAAGATVQRQTADYSDPQALICCSQYGQEYRHSDPHIGAGVNQLVYQGNIVTLADPVGLYIQTPDFSLLRLPPNHINYRRAEPSRTARKSSGVRRPETTQETTSSTPSSRSPPSGPE